MTIRDLLIHKACVSVPLHLRSIREDVLKTITSSPCCPSDGFSLPSFSHFCNHHHVPCKARQLMFGHIWWQPVSIAHSSDDWMLSLRPQEIQNSILHYFVNISVTILYYFVNTLITCYKIIHFTSYIYFLNWDTKMQVPFWVCGEQHGWSGGQLLLKQLRELRCQFRTLPISSNCLLTYAFICGTK